MLLGGCDMCCVVLCCVVLGGIVWYCVVMCGIE